MGFPISGACGVTPGDSTAGLRAQEGDQRQPPEHHYVRCGPAQSHCNDAAQHQHLVKKLATKKRRSTGHNKIQRDNILLSCSIFCVSLGLLFTCAPQTKKARWKPYFCEGTK